MKTITLLPLLLLFGVVSSEAQSWLLVSRQGKVISGITAPQKPDPRPGLAWVYHSGPLLNYIKYDWRTQTASLMSQTEINSTTSAEELPFTRRKLLDAQTHLSSSQDLGDNELIRQYQTEVSRLQAEMTALRARILP